MGAGSVTVTPRALWRLRLRREAPRYLVQAVALFGLLASARYAVDPPVPTLVRAPTSAATADRAAEGFAVLFARRYLSFQAGEPEAHRRALVAYLGAEMEVDAGYQPPEQGVQHVLWAEVVGAEAQAGGARRYTVAAQTDASGLVYLSVGVVREPDGALALAGYPAIVGAPLSTTGTASPQLGEVQDGALVTVLGRALRNYLAGSASELAADLSADAQIATPSIPLQLEAVESLGWEPGGRSVLALVRARDRVGGRYSLAYCLYVVEAGGRWELAGIQAAPSG